MLYSAIDIALSAKSHDIASEISLEVIDFSNMCTGRGR